MLSARYSRKWIPITSAMWSICHDTSLLIAAQILDFYLGLPLNLHLTLALQNDSCENPLSYIISRNIHALAYSQRDKSLVASNGEPKEENTCEAKEKFENRDQNRKFWNRTIFTFSRKLNLSVIDI